MLQILIYGMSGLGAEIAKNVILSGVKSVRLHDDQVVAWKDLSSHFYLGEDDIGKNRATASLEQLRELNNYVDTSASEGEVGEDLIGQFDVVVAVDQSLDTLLRIGELTHPRGIKLVAASALGLFALVFNDFGENFEVSDVNGEQPISAMLASITAEGVVTCLDEQRHGFEDGDYVTFSEVDGMPQLNGCEPIKIKVLGPYTFGIGEVDESKGKYVKGGVATQVKVPQKFSFKPLKDSLKGEDSAPTDFGKFDRMQQIQLAYITLNDFVKAKGRMPTPWSAGEATEFVKMATDKAKEVFGEDGPEPDEKLLTLFSKVCSGNLSPVTAAFGGLVAQEVLKAVSGKFMPIKQWMHFDALECLPREEPTEEDCKPSDCRYDGQTAVFGNKFQEKLLKQKWFVVGSGAIGCELLKNFAMVSFLLLFLMLVFAHQYYRCTEHSR